MKYYLLLFFVLFFTSSVFSQDLIVKNDKTEIKAKIEEITETHIKYKKFEMLDGPTFNINLNDVFMILYKNGTKEYVKSQVPIKTETVVSETKPKLFKESDESKTKTDKKAIENKDDFVENKLVSTGTHPEIVVKKSFWSTKYNYGDQRLKRFNDFSKVYEQNGYSDLSKKLNNAKPVRIGLLVVSEGCLFLSLYRIAKYGTYYEIYRDPVWYLGLITGTVNGFYTNHVLDNSIDEFNLRAKNKIGQTIHLSPTLGFNPVNKSGQLGVNIKF